MSYFFPREKLYFLVAAIVLAVMSLAAAWRSARQARQGRWAELSAAARSDALLIAPLIYLAFTTTNLQGARDLLPLLPFVAILSAWAAVRCLDLVTGRLLGKGAALVRWRAGVAAGLAAVILFFTVGDAFSSAAPELRLREQERDVAQIVRHVGPDDTIFSHDAAGLLVLAGLNNGNEFFFVQRHLAGYFDAHVPGGFERWLAQQRARRPAVVVIGPRPMSHERQIEAWLDQDYEEQRHRTYRWYLRKDLAPG